MKKLKLMMLLSLVAFSLASCAKEGCTDPDSINYDPDAKKSDGSCQYEGEMVLWYGEETAEGLLTDGVTSLTYYADGEIIGSSAANIYYTGAPDCGDNGTITITRNLGSLPSQSVHVEVQDQDGITIWEEHPEANANTCTKYELTY